jgi:hypothetical protein
MRIATIFFMYTHFYYFHKDIQGYAQFGFLRIVSPFWSWNLNLVTMEFAEYKDNVGG